MIAFGELHRSLLVGARSDWISVPYYVEHLCKALSDALLEPRGVTFEVHVDAGELRSEQCELFGLVIAELVTNAAKHAFCDGVDGIVRVELVRQAHGWLCVVSDNGDGAGAVLPGIGSKIIEQLVQTMGGRIARRSSASGTSIAVTLEAYKDNEELRRLSLLTSGNGPLQLRRGVMSTPQVSLARACKHFIRDNWTAEPFPFD